MYPLLIAALVAIAVVGERLVWWFRAAGRRDPAAVAAALKAAEAGDWSAAEQAVAKSLAVPSGRMPSAGRLAASTAIRALAASLTLPSPPPAITRGTPSREASATNLTASPRSQVTRTSSWCPADRTACTASRTSGRSAFLPLRIRRACM